MYDPVISFRNLLIGWLAVLPPLATVMAQPEEPSFPYNALVVEESVKIYSGPGSVHYATDELQKNAIVDVYRHDPGGWCAIRPPASSFSLVPAAAVKRLANDIGQIEEDGVQAWVGTRFGSVEQPLWQVKLKKGEQVQIVGQVSWPENDEDASQWLQIAPPAGEFRWIRFSDLKLPENDDELPPDSEDRWAQDEVGRIPDTIRDDKFSSSASSSSDRVALSAFQSRDWPPSRPPVSPPSEKDATRNKGWRQARRPLGNTDRTSGATTTEPFKTPAVDATTGRANVDQDRLAGTLANPANGTNWNSVAATNMVSRFSESMMPIAGPVSTRIRNLETELTQEMLKAPAEWQLESILRRATRVATTTDDHQEREHANRLIVKIRNCAVIQADYEESFGRNAATSLPLSPVGTGVATDTGVGVLDTQVQLGATYDAYGWLNELIRDKGKLTPTFVLEDDEGKIICHVAPAPGLNLKRYLKNKVGVIGRRGFHRELKLNHVTAERVVVLDKLRR